jgi:aspartate racemase
MKTIGLLGGTTWESTLDYYRIINREVMRRTDGVHTARIVLYSLDFHDVDARASSGKFDEIAQLAGDAAVAVEHGGADCLLVCANTMHMFADRIQARVSIPLIHIIRATLAEVQNKNFSKVGLLGTKPTMEMDFYRNILDEGGVEVLIPEAGERDFISNAIFRELGKGLLIEGTKKEMIAIMEGLVKRGAQGVILGCTEIPLLVKQGHTPIPLFDTTYIHAIAGVDFALSS